ncbi:MAG TPA: spondin domain-containing protein, partial [Candidatus Methylomirabilis sp.]|nr:spondin domain-containing protein [Candidatus Methylomirabilis sp.]
MKGKTFGIAWLMGAALGVVGTMVGTSHAAMAPQQFIVRIENVSTENTLKPSNGAKAPAAVAPGLWIIHRDGEPLFTPGTPDRGKGLESLAEEGNPSALAMSLREQAGASGSGVFNTPVGASGPGPIGPGGVFEFTISAAPASRLSFAMMFGQSNDLFYAPDAKGIALFDANGRPRSGDITS